MISREPRGIRTGGRFAADSRAEPSLTLARGPAASNLYRRYTENEMSRTEQRELSRRMIRTVHEAGTLTRMAGLKNLSAVYGVLEAAQDDDRLDAAIHAVVNHEQRHPGTVAPETIGYQLCRRLLAAETSGEEAA